MSLLIDELMPTWDVRERHTMAVDASREATYEAITRADLAPPLVRALLLLRALPEALARGRSGVDKLRSRGREPITLRTFERNGFRILAERRPEEIVIGLEGRFWTSSGALCETSLERFRDTAPAPGAARAAWNFVVRRGRRGVILETETRVQCADGVARRRFLPYWYLIRPGSGLIRRAMLRQIRRTAEAAGHPATAATR